jgi:hypothetical protein
MNLIYPSSQAKEAFREMLERTYSVTETTPCKADLSSMIAKSKGM